MAASYSRYCLYTPPHAEIIINYAKIKANNFSFLSSHSLSLFVAGVPVGRHIGEYSVPEMAENKEKKFKLNWKIKRRTQHFFLLFK